MALIKCKECARDVSDLATACPNCGAPIAKPAPPRSGSGCGVAILAVIGAVIFIAILVPFIDSPDTPRSAVPATSSTTSPRHPFEPAQQNGVALQVQAQRLINSAGERCDAVANVRAGGRVDNGDVFLLADCVGGDTHALLLTPNDQIRYYMSCEAFVNPVC
jgi:hypothetical protein